MYDSMLTLGLITQIVVLYFLFTRTLTYLRLCHIPGPLISSVSYLPLIRATLSGRAHKKYVDLSKRYGSLVRIGPQDLLASDPDLLRRMSSVRSPYQRSGWYSAVRLDPHVDNILSELNTREHDARRAKMASGYSGKDNTHLEADIDACIAMFVELIEQKYLSKGSTLQLMDLARKVQFFTLDVITRAAYGDAFGYLAQDADVHDQVKIAEQVIPFLSLCATVPFLNQALNRMWVSLKLGPRATDHGGIGKVMGIAKQVVGERFGEDKVDKRDMLGAWVRNGISQRQCESEVVLQIFAGSDTTATAIRATLLYVLTNPRIHRKLQREIDSAPISSPITNDEARELPYLQAVIKESLRIHPPIPGLLSKRVPPGGDIIDGHYIPEGTRIGHNIWSAQRSQIFGADPNIFRPERWIEAEREQLLQMQQCTDLVFGYGRWGCLGKQLALVELNKITVEVSKVPLYGEDY